MDVQWVTVAHSAWEWDPEAELRNLKAQGFEPASEPPNIHLVPEADLIKIECKRVDPG